MFIGPYRLVSQLGRGGMGTVHLAVVEGVVPGVPVGERVALKVLHPDLVRDLDVFERFVHEATLGKRIRHENVVRTLDAGMDFGDESDQVYLAMEYVVGQTLAALRREAGRLPEGVCRRVAREVARGLQGIHECGVVHGDLKPENVLVTRDEVVKVMDLGLARLRGMSLRSTGAGRFEGTFLYAAPEQFAEGARPIDARADLYALGVTLFEMLTGVHPFAHDDVRVVMHRHLHETPPRVRALAPEVSELLDEVVARLLAKDPAERFRSSAELLSVLARAEDSTWWRGRAGSSAGNGARDKEAVRVHGREEQLVALLDAVRELGGSRGRVVLVEGEPGSGKTRLAQELASLLGSGETAMPVQFAPTAGAAAAILAATSPAVVVVDDLERATASEAAELVAAAAGVPRLPVMLLVTLPAGRRVDGRAELASVPGVLLVRLPRLSRDALQALADEALDAGRAADAVVEWLALRSDGNPRIALALLHDLRATDALAMAADGTWRPSAPLRGRALPDTVRRMLAARIETLPAADREFLDAVACAGDAFDVTLLAAALGEDRGAIAVRLGALVRHGILRSEDGEHFAFDSRALREVAHGLVQEMLRPEYHRMLADAERARAGEPPPPEAACRIARHLIDAGAPAEALPYVEPAVRRLAAEGRWEDALALVEPVLLGGGSGDETLGSETLRLRLRILAARACLALSQPAAAERFLAPEGATGPTTGMAARARALKGS